MKISFEIVDNMENHAVEVHHLLLEGKITPAVIAVLPGLFGRITGSILRDCIADPMKKLRLSRASAKKFRKVMDDEIHGTSPMVKGNIVVGRENG